MITLLDIELRRALARRLVRVTTVAAVAAILITFVIVLVRSHGSSGTPSRAFPYSHEQVEACARGELLPPQYEGAPPQILDQLPPDSPRRRALCERAFGQQFTSEEDRRFRLTHLHNVLQGTSGVLFVIAWLFGA